MAGGQPKLEGMEEERRGHIYEFSNDRRADGVDEVDEELEEEHCEQKRRHD